MAEINVTFILMFAIESITIITRMKLRKIVKIDVKGLNPKALTKNTTMKMTIIIMRYRVVRLIIMIIMPSHHITSCWG